MSLRTKTRRITGWLLGALALGASGPVAAVDIGDLYQVSVASSGLARADVFRQGMSDVLVRVTGRRDAAELPELAALIDGSSRYVSSYRRAAAGRLLLSFDGDAIEDAVTAAGLPFWGPDRPLTLIWLAVDHGGGQRDLVTARSAAAERRALEQVAATRGLPVVFPAGSDESRARLEQVWAGDNGQLAAAASSYGASGVLVGRATSTGAGTYSVDWSFVGAGASAQRRGDLEEGVHLATDRFASLYASAGAGRRSELEVAVAGLDTVSHYADATHYLEALPVVREVTVDEIGPDTVRFRVIVRGDIAALRQAAAADGRLVPVDAGDGLPTFRFVP